MEAELQRCTARNKKVAELFEKLYVDNVEGKVYETEGTGKNCTQRIIIHYKFMGVIELPNFGDNYTADTRKGVAVEYVTKSA